MAISAYVLIMTFASMLVGAQGQFLADSTLASSVPTYNESSYLASSDGTSYQRVLREDSMAAQTGQAVTNMVVSYVVVEPCGSAS